MTREASEKVRLVLTAKVEKKATLQVPSAEAGQVERILQGTTKWNGREDYITGFIVDFGGGVQVDVTVLNGEPPYVDVVLFDEGREVMTGTVRDCLLGTSSFFYNGGLYTVEVVEG